MKKLLCAALSLFVLLSCFPCAFAAQETDAGHATGTPWLCSNLDGIVTADTQADLKDDFYLAVNREKLLDLEIGDTYNSAGTIMDNSHKVDSDIRDLFTGEAPEGHDQKLAWDLYHLMMDWDTRNALGAAPLKEEIDLLESIDSLEKLTAYFVETPYVDVYIPWSLESDADIDDSSHNRIYFAPMSLLLGDSAEYASLTEYGAIRKDAMTGLARKMLMKVGYTEQEALEKLDGCLAFETLMAPSIYTSEEANSADYISKIRNYYSRAMLQELMGPLPVLDFCERLGYPAEDEYIVMDPAFFESLRDAYTEENVNLFRDFLIVHAVVNASSVLDRECYEWNLEATLAMTGAASALPDDMAFSSTVADLLPWPVARLYSDTYLDAADKVRIADMIDEILACYHGILSDADFLSEPTRAKALEKLDAIGVHVLYPDSWEPYSCDGLDYASAGDGGTLWDAMDCISVYFLRKNIRDHSEPVDKDLWVLPPQVFNCYYSPKNNTVNILGAFAQGTIYNSGMSDEELYAKLGCVIAHEISHAFDSTGSQFDKDGNLASWWTDEDYGVFLERNDKLARYYNEMHPWEGQDFYGGIMTGEACADMGGMKCVLMIAAEKEGFDYDAFFRAFADLWLSKSTYNRVLYELTDVHPLAYLRVNCTLQQFDEFLDCYGITEGDGMYLAPEDRVAIW